MTPEEYAKHKHSERQLAYYYAHHEKLKEYARKHNREYYAKNRERILERQRQKRYEKNNFSPAADDSTGNPGSGRT